MGNHYHLVVRPRKENLSRAMQWLGVSYASYFNRRYERSGHLSQGRFKSFAIEEQDYLRKLILYVHRNPLRTRLVDRLADYRWGSYGCLTSGRSCVSWLRGKEVLQLFGNRPERFRKEVQKYSKEEESLLENMRFGLYLGGEAALASLREQLKGKVHREKPQSRRLSRSESVDEAVESLREVLGVSRNEIDALRKPVRRRQRPMSDLLIRVLWRRSDHRLSEIGEYFEVGYTTISNAHLRGERLVQADKKLAGKLREFLAMGVE